MTSKQRDFTRLVPDPYPGEGYVFPTTLCSDERRLWFRRNNEILGFFRIVHHVLQRTAIDLRKKRGERVLEPETIMKISGTYSWALITSAQRYHDLSVESVEILARQVFVMLYGSLETYLLQLLERSFAQIGHADNVLDRSLDILMKRRWDGKFCAMRDAFSLDYQASHLIDHFRGFGMVLELKTYANPLEFLDELAKIRHRIVHASSISQHGQMIFINGEIFPFAHAFYALLTDYVDSLFCTRFRFDRRTLDPGSA